MLKKKKHIGHIVFVIGFFIALTCVFTRPLVSHVRTHFPGGHGDNLYFIWQIEWFKRAIFDLRQLPIKSHLLNHPYGYNLATTEMTPLQLAFGIPFALFGNPVLGYNISILSTFVLAGLTMYAWVFSLTKSHLASLAAGSVFSFLPYHIAHVLIGHLNISGIQWFPLYFWGFTAILLERSFSKKNMFLFAGGLSAIALTSIYYFYMTVFLSAILMIFYFLFIDPRAFKDWDMWKQFLLGGLMSVPFLVVGVGPYLVFYGGSATSRNFQSVMVFSASILDYVLPFTRQFFLGEWVWKNFPRDLWNEATLYLGLPAMVSAAFAWTRKKERRPLLTLILVGFLTAVILSFGTNVMWKEQPVQFDPPDWLVDIFPGEKGIILLPGYVLYRFMPYYDLMRVWMRYGIFAILFCSAAAGIGFNLMLKKIPKKKRSLAGIGILLLVLLDLYGKPMKISSIGPRVVDEWLDDQPQGGLVQLPYDLSLSETHFFYTLYHEKSLVGAVPAFPSQRFLDLRLDLESFPSDRSLAALEENQVRYVLVDEASMPVDDDFIAFCEQLGMPFQGSFGGQSVFIIE